MFMRQIVLGSIVFGAGSGCSSTVNYYAIISKRVYELRAIIEWVSIGVITMCLSFRASKRERLVTGRWPNWGFRETEVSQLVEIIKFGS